MEVTGGPVEVYGPGAWARGSTAGPGSSCPTAAMWTGSCGTSTGCGGCGRSAARAASRSVHRPVTPWASGPPPTRARRRWAGSRGHRRGTGPPEERDPHLSRGPAQGVTEGAVWDAGFSVAMAGKSYAALDVLHAALCLSRAVGDLVQALHAHHRSGVSMRRARSRRPPRCRRRRPASGTVQPPARRPRARGSNCGARWRRRRSWWTRCAGRRGLRPAMIPGLGLAGRRAALRAGRGPGPHPDRPPGPSPAGGRGRASGRARGRPPGSGRCPARTGVPAGFRTGVPAGFRTASRRWASRPASVRTSVQASSAADADRMAVGVRVVDEVSMARATSARLMTSPDGQARRRGGSGPGPACRSGGAGGPRPSRALQQFRDCIRSRSV